MRSVRLPSIVEIFPSMFVPVITLEEMEQRAQESIPDQVSSCPWCNIHTGADMEEPLTKKERMVLDFCWIREISSLWSSSKAYRLFLPMLSVLFVTFILVPLFKISWIFLLLFFRRSLVFSLVFTYMDLREISNSYFVLSLFITILLCCFVSCWEFLNFFLECIPTNF